MIASFIPPVGVINSAPIMLTGPKVDILTECCLLGNLNSFVLDYVARQKIGNVNLNFFIVEQLPIFPPEFYADRCPWDKRQSLEKWISSRVLKLSCTSNDMKPLAEAAELDPPVHRWKPDDRAKLMAELDAAYFLLYGMTRDEVEYILSTFGGKKAKQASFLNTSDVTGRILKHYDALVLRSSKA